MKERNEHQPIRRRNEDSSPKRQNPMAQNLDSNGAPNDLLNISSDQGQLRHEPKHQSGPIGVLLTAELRQMAAGGDADSRRQELDEQAHNCGPQEQPEQRVASDGAGLEIPLEVPWIQKSYAHQEPRPREQPQLLPRERRDYVRIHGFRRVLTHDQDLLLRLEGHLLIILVVRRRLRRRRGSRLRS